MLQGSNTSKDNKNTAWSLIFFLLWPALSFLYFLKRYSLSYSKVIFFLFYGLFGFTFIINERSDSSRHIQYLANSETQSLSDFIYILMDPLSGGNKKPDYLMDSINYLISRFTINPQFYFLTLSLLFGWFVVKNLNIQYRVYLERKNLTSYIFIVFFIVLLSPMRIVSFGHYFALVVFVYCFYKFITQKKDIYLFIAALSVFIHYGFVFAFGLLIIYRFIGNNNKLYYILILLSILFHENAASIIREYGLALDIGLQQSIKGYTNEAYLEKISEIQQNRNFILDNYIRATTLFFIISMILLKLRVKKLGNISEHLYSFSLLFFSFVNFTQDLESITNRFSIMLQVLCCIFFIDLFAKKITKPYKPFLASAIILLILNTIIILRITLEYTGVALVSPLAPLILIYDLDLSVLELIK